MYTLILLLALLSTDETGHCMLGLVGEGIWHKLLLRAHTRQNVRSAFTPVCSGPLQMPGGSLLFIASQTCEGRQSVDANHAIQHCCHRAPILFME